MLLRQEDRKPVQVRIDPIPGSQPAPAPTGNLANAAVVAQDEEGIFLFVSLTSVRHSNIDKKGLVAQEFHSRTLYVHCVLPQGVAATTKGEFSNKGFVGATHQLGIKPGVSVPVQRRSQTDHPPRCFERWTILSSQRGDIQVDVPH